MGASEVSDFLTYLAKDKNVAASTQNQALNALVFLYKQVLGREVGQITAYRARQPKHLPTVLSRQEVKSILSQLSGTKLLIAELLYGCGLRLTEALKI